MNNQLTTTNQNAKLALLKSKSLIDITNKLLANRTSKDLVQSVENFRLSVISGHEYLTQLSHIENRKFPI